MALLLPEWTLGDIKSIPPVGIFINFVSQKFSKIWSHLTSERTCIRSSTNGLRYGPVALQIASDISIKLDNILDADWYLKLCALYSYLGTDIICGINWIVGWLPNSHSDCIRINAHVVAGQEKPHMCILPLKMNTEQNIWWKLIRMSLNMFPGLKHI